MNLRKLIENYLKEATLMQLATAINNQPWICSVWFVSDSDLNLYWFSSTKRRHSDEIIKNQKVAAAIVLPHTPDDVPRGLQVQGVAELLTDKKDIEKVISLYESKIFPKEKIIELMNLKEHPHLFYKMKPTQFVLYDAVNFPDNSRQEYNII